MSGTGESLPVVPTEQVDQQAPVPEAPKPAEVAQALAEDPRLKEASAKMDALASATGQTVAGKEVALAEQVVEAAQQQVETGTTASVAPAPLPSTSTEGSKESSSGLGALGEAIKELIDSIAAIFKKDPDKKDKKEKDKKPSKSSNDSEDGEAEKEWPNEEYEPQDPDAPVWSVPEGVVTTLTSIKGPRTPPETNQGHGSSDHKGDDFSMAEKTPILLTAGHAVVKFVKTQVEGAGHYIALELEDGAVAYFMHLFQEPPFKPGDVLERGDVIALSGNTGNSSGPHLHFEVHRGSDVVDPQDYLQEPYHNEHEDERRVV